MASTYHEVLDLSEDASMNAVRTAYREKVKEYHPDISDHPDAKKRFQQLKSAYEVLSSRKRRERYERMGHNKYVDQYGGYSSDELEQTTEIQLVKQETQTNRAESNSKEEFANHDKQGSTRSEQNEVSKGTWISWIIQGRTSENDGTVPYIIRLSVYTILLLVGIFISKPIFGGSNALISNFPAFLILLCGARIVYLSVFEHLREEYVKIDQSPEPDSYAIPYALAFGLLGLTLPLFSLFPQVLGMSLETYPIALAIVLGV
ncbi:DnaJ domain-containing protein, partial [Halopenitus malekzadehii]